MAFNPNENPYQGVNAHLNSELQTPGSRQAGRSSWPSFHADHTTYITQFLNAKLPPMYIARTEESLQIRVQDDLFGPPRVSAPEPDITIYQRTSTQTGGMSDAAAATPVALAIDETLDLTEDFLRAVVIREVSQNERWGQVVTLIELLSPTNKPGHVGYELYRRKRNEFLYSNLPLIELDYLHESPPPLLNYPVYPYEANSHPYHIFVNDPRPTLETGQVLAYRFDVDQPFPQVTIPLSGDDTLQFDFGAIYQHTFSVGRWGESLNYSAPPPRFETYHPADRVRIEAVMARVQAARESAN